MGYSLLADIDKEKGGDTEKCKAAMFHAWLQSGTATKISLVDALRMMERHDLAAKVV